MIDDINGNLSGNGSSSEKDPFSRRRRTWEDAISEFGIPDTSGSVTSIRSRVSLGRLVAAAKLESPPRHNPPTM